MPDPRGWEPRSPEVRARMTPERADEVLRYVAEAVREDPKIIQYVLEGMGPEVEAIWAEAVGGRAGRAVEKFWERLWFKLSDAHSHFVDKAPF